MIEQRDRNVSTVIEAPYVLAALTPVTLCIGFHCGGTALLELIPDSFNSVFLYHYTCHETHSSPVASSTIRGLLPPIFVTLYNSFKPVS